jgi:DNA-binding response OmpR family regulator
MGRKILVCEDDPAILHGVADLLEDEGYTVITATDGHTGYKLACDEDPDLVILDVMMPRKSGIEVCRKLHEDRTRAAVLLLTAKATDRDKIRGLQAGADDYLTKPFNVSELLLRVRALLRRTPESDDRLQEFRFGDIEIDFARFEAQRGNQRLELTPREFKIMRLFCEEPGRVVTRNELLDKVWGYDVFPTTRTVDNHIVKLRKAIEPEPGRPRYIISVRGVGYKFDPTAT